MNDIFFILGFIFIVLTIISLKIASIYEKKVQNEYKLAKKRLKNNKKRQNDDDDEGDEVDEFIDSLPPWLRGIAEGSGLNLEAVYYGDPAEVQKIGKIIEKNLPGSPGQKEEYL